MQLYAEPAVSEPPRAVVTSSQLVVSYCVGTGSPGTIITDSFKLLCGLLGIELR